MKKRRLRVLFIAFIIGFQVLLLRLFVIVTQQEYSEAAASQSSYTQTVKKTRPDFYDCNGRLLSGGETTYKAIITPSDSSALNVIPYLAESEKETFVERLRSERLPFLVELVEKPPSYTLIQTVEFSDRYSSDTLAMHLLGYTDSDGSGMTGLERALDDFLAANTIETRMSIQVNARGEAILGAEVSFYDDSEDSGGVVLSIDKEIQQLAENIAKNNFERGAIVVVEVATGEIKAAVSLPTYDPNDVAAAILADDTSLINRCFTAYNVGSVYKPIVAAAAIESGVSEFWYECTGECDIDGQVYTCNNYVAHGAINMQMAVRDSCNCYFIELGQRIGRSPLYNMALSVGLGQQTEVYPGLSSAAGVMPALDMLSSSGELANHCFGQGYFMATPLQVALYTNAIANGGVYMEPVVVRSVGGAASERAAGTRVMSADTAGTIAWYMNTVVRSASDSQPMYTSAAGKTGTAQTGAYYQDGAEKTIGWFTGFFPYEDPQYTITVLVEDGQGYANAAPVFRQLADAIYYSQHQFDQAPAS